MCTHIDVGDIGGFAVSVVYVPSLENWQERIACPGAGVLHRLWCISGLSTSNSHLFPEFEVHTLCFCIYSCAWRYVCVFV